MRRRVKTYFITTIGCQMNKSDSERLAGYLGSLGIKMAKERKQADLILLNTCGVRQSAEDRVYGLAKRIREENPKAKLAITGCLAGRKDVQKRLKDGVDSWIPIGEYNLLSKKLEVRSKKYKNYFCLKPQYNSKISAYVPIGNGCNNFCSYCVVPYARGREVWRPAEDILNEVRELLKKGYKEITLIAQNVNSYKSQISNLKSQINSKFKTRNSKIDFSGLLRLVNAIPGDFWVRFTTSHPKDMSDELIMTIAECEKVCEHVHLPVQAGDNAILKAMNRGYTINNYRKLVARIRKNFQFSIFPPKADPPLADNFQTISNNRFSNFKKLHPVAITTDVIVGFPGETKKQFANTKKLFRDMKFDQAYVARYSPRPGTAAERLIDSVLLEEKKRREKILEKIVSRSVLANNKKYLSRIVEILVEGKNRRGEWHGHTRTNKNISVNAGADNIEVGDFIYVKVKEANDFGLRGEFYHKKSRLIE